MVSKPVLIDREEAAKVAEAAFERAHTYASENADAYRAYDNGQRCAMQNIAAALRALPPYTTAPAQPSPTTEAQERSRRIFEDARDSVQCLSAHQEATACFTCEGLEEKAIINAFAAALSSTPSVSEAIAEVTRLRDENKRNYEYWKSIASSPNTDFGVLKFAAWAGEDERIITALEALLPSTPSDEVRSIVENWASSEPDAIDDLDALCRIAELMNIEVQPRTPSEMKEDD